MPFRSRTSVTTIFANDSQDDLPLPVIGKSSAEKVSSSAGTAPVSSTLHGTLPAPATQGSVSSRGKGKKKSARVDRGLKVHWAKFRRRIGTGTAPSTSSAPEPDESGDTYSNGIARFEAQQEVEDDVVDEVVVDREWSDEIKSLSVSHSEHGGTPEKSGSNPLGTNTDRESLSMHPVGFWALCPPLVFVRWRIWPMIHGFFVNHFVDEKSEVHYNKENWFLRKNLALWSSAFYILNWVLATAFLQTPATIADKIFYYGVSPALTFPVLIFVMWDFPRDREVFYQIWLVFATWMWSTYQIIFIYICGYYGSPIILPEGTKDFLTLFYYTSAMQTVGLFGLKLNRFPAMCAALVFFILAAVLTLPYHHTFIRNLINFLAFQAFLLYIHYMRENAERRLFTLRDQLKIQFRATQKAQVNERKAADSKRRLTSYVFHDKFVRVPLNTALLAVQNMEAHGAVPKAQEIEFKALEGSLSMMSKVLNDVLDFNRMDSGRFESVLKPYSFHQVMRSMFVPLQLATDARDLAFVTDLDRNIDEVTKKALYEAMGESHSLIEKRLRENPDEDGIVVGDETRLRQIITNLASNACKFTPAGGKLTIRTKLILPEVYPTEDQPEIDTLKTRVNGSAHESQATSSLLKVPSVWDPKEHTETSSPPMPHRLSASHLTQHNTIHSKPPPLEWIVVRIEVSDTGYGIRPKDMVQSKLFSAFNQTEQGRLQGGKGTGLGLALVRQIVKLSGGRLGVRSKVGEGSTFWVELPLGVGSKVTPALLMPIERDDVLDTPSSFTRTVKSNVTMQDFSPDSSALSSSQPNRSASALHSIMEQGGLVEMTPKRGERGAIPTRTIGDPSTGTHTITDDTTPPAAPEEPPVLTKDSSSATVRPRLSQLPKPRTFSFDPPASPSGSTATSSTGNTGIVSAGADAPLKVLVVDDDLLTRKLMTRMLTRLGCKVATAENGELALEMILGTGQRATPSEEDTGSGGLSLEGSMTAGEEYRFAVIFLDNQMPVLSGLNAVSKLREMGRRDFVVGVTGNALLSDQQEYLDAGADHVLTKPVLEKSLKSMLAIADERRKQRPASAGEQPHSPGPTPASP